MLFRQHENRREGPSGLVTMWHSYEPDPQATRDAVLGAKVREAVGPRREARWARIAAAIANDDLTRRVWFAIGRALEAEAQADAAKEATDG